MNRAEKRNLTHARRLLREAGIPSAPSRWISADLWASLAVGFLALVEFAALSWTGVPSRLGGSIATTGIVAFAFPIALNGARSHNARLRAWRRRHGKGTDDEVKRALRRVSLHELQKIRRDENYRRSMSRIPPVYTRLAWPPTPRATRRSLLFAVVFLMTILLWAGGLAVDRWAIAAMGYLAATATLGLSVLPRKSDPRQRPSRRKPVNRLRLPDR